MASRLLPTLGDFISTSHPARNRRRRTQCAGGKVPILSLWLLFIGRIHATAKWRQVIIWFTLPCALRREWRWHLSERQVKPPKVVTGNDLLDHVTHLCGATCCAAAIRSASRSWSPWCSPSALLFGISSSRSIAPASSRRPKTRACL